MSGFEYPWGKRSSGESKALEARIAALEQKVAALENKPTDPGGQGQA